VENAILFCKDALLPILQANVLFADAHDVIPAPISVPPSKVHFQSVDTLITNASQWLSGNDLKDVVSLQVVELPFKPKHLGKPLVFSFKTMFLNMNTYLSTCLNFEKVVKKLENTRIWFIRTFRSV